MPSSFFSEDSLLLMQDIDKTFSLNVIESYVTWLYKIIQAMIDDYVDSHKEIVNEEAENLLNDLQYSLIQIFFWADCIVQG